MEQEVLVSSAASDKIKFTQRNFEVGDVALFLEENRTFFEWPLARVVKIYLMRDIEFRSVKIKIASGCYTRYCVKLKKNPSKS